MQLSDLNSGTPDTKPWLNIISSSLETNDVKTDTLTANDFDVGDIVSDSMTINEQKSVPNPAVGKLTLFADTSGNLNTTDSNGDTLTYATTDDTKQITNLNNEQDNQLQSLAPYGQRDLWQYTASTPAGAHFQLHYSTYLSKLYMGGNAAASYSTDGGTTNIAVVFDTPPAGAVYFSSKPSLAIALTTTSQTYTSTDGINFALGAAAPTTYFGYDISYSAALDLFIAPANVDASHKIITSQDGLTWTARLSPDILINSIKCNADIIVAVGELTPYIMWSEDGITWTASSTPLHNACRTVEYSSDQKIWCASQHGGSNDTFTSTNGKTWVDTGFDGPGFSGPSLIWLPSPYLGWYASSSYQGNYSLYHTPDPRISNFRAINLDGAVAGLIDYYLVYIASLDRLVLSTTTSPYIAFNVTKRPYDIKSLRDNIRVRGAPVSTALYSTYADATCNNTTAETAVSSPASVLGNLVLQLPQPQGMVRRITLGGLATSAGGDTLTLKYYAGATGTTLLFTHTIVIAALSVNVPIPIVSNLTIRAATIQVNSRDSFTPLTVSSTPAYNPAILNTFRITAQWGAAINQFVVNQLFIEDLFRNGA